MTHVLRTYRDEAGITLQDLAERAGTSKANLSKIENGVSFPSRKLLDRLSLVTGIPRDAILPALESSPQ